MAIRSAPDTERSETTSGGEARADRAESDSEAMAAPVRTPADRAETRRRGEATYERDIKPTLSEDQLGRIVAIDVDSGCWAIADDSLQASADLRAQRPEASDVWLRRVGYRAAFGFAGHPSRDDDSSGEARADRVESNSEASPTPVRTRADREATHRRGEEIYERDIEPLLADGQRGRIVAIDIDSGCWAIADDELQASADLRTQRPEATDVWLLRVGYRVAHSFAGHWSRYPR